MRLIDRDRLLTERMKSKYYHLPNGDIAVPLIDIENAPVVDAVPVRRGKWEQMYSGKFVGGAYWFSCSECKRIVPGGLSGGYNFCPNCGARMGDSNG